MPGCLLDVVGRSNTLRPRAAEQRCLFHALASGDESNGRVLHQQTSVVISLSSTYHTTTHTHSLLAFRNPRAPRACVYIHTQTHIHAHSLCGLPLLHCPQLERFYNKKNTNNLHNIPLEGKPLKMDLMWRGKPQRWVNCDNHRRNTSWLLVLREDIDLRAVLPKKLSEARRNDYAPHGWGGKREGHGNAKLQMRTVLWQDVNDPDPPLQLISLSIVWSSFISTAIVARRCFCMLLYLVGVLEQNHIELLCQ